MARAPYSAKHLSDAELLARIAKLARDLQTTIEREGWTAPSAAPSIAILQTAVREAETRLLRHQEKAREKLCQQRFGRYSDDELLERISRLELELMSAMEVSGPPQLTVNTIAEQLHCACLVASKRPSLWAKLVAEGHCKGPVSQQPPAQT